LYRVVQTSRLYEQIVEQIERSILQGSLKTGDQLPAERELAQQFGVSRTAVREAIKTLREKGLVRLQPGRGTFITNGTSRTIRQSLDFMTRIGQLDGLAHLSEVRAVIEPEIAALAATRIEEPHIAAMREAISVMDRSRKNPEAYIEADLDFHLALAEAVANPIILTLIDSIVDLLREQRLRIFWVPGGPERGQVHHKLILQAIEQRDPVNARLAMSAHLQQVAIDARGATGKSQAFKTFAGSSEV
jgi:GntR family transcriptional repressor for pyruvate dehydrogenase complex